MCAPAAQLGAPDADKYFEVLAPYFLKVNPKTSLVALVYVCPHPRQTRFPERRYVMEVRLQW